MLLTRPIPIYRISHLHYDPQNQKLLQSYPTTPSGPYNLPIKFIPTPQPPTRWNKFFLDRHLRLQFQLVMAFIHESGSNSPIHGRQRFSNIEETLQTRMEGYIKSRPQKVLVHECEVGRAYYVEERKVYGVFFDRRLNLAKNCYSTEFDTKTKDIRYRLRSKLTRAQDLQDLQRAHHLFQSHNYSTKYRDTYSGFQQSQYITRSLIKIIADVKVQIQIPDLKQSIRLGYQGPTQHMLQVESYKVPYQEKEWAVTDVDFFMEGNFWFAKERNL